MMTETLEYEGRCVTLYGELHMTKGEYPIVSTLASLPLTTTIILEGDGDTPMHECGIKAAHQALKSRAISLPVLTDYWRPFVKAARSAILCPIEQIEVPLYGLAALLQINAVDFFRDIYDVPPAIEYRALATFNDRRIEYLDNLASPMTRYRAILALATLQFEIEVYREVVRATGDCVVYCGRSHLDTIKYFCS